MTAILIGGALWLLCGVLVVLMFVAAGDADDSGNMDAAFPFTDPADDDPGTPP